MGASAGAAHASADGCGVGVTTAVFGSASSTSTTFEVAQEAADEFARRVQRRDKRDPHLVIHRETFRGGPGSSYGASRTKQSR